MASQAVAGHAGEHEDIAGGGGDGSGGVVLVDSKVDDFGDGQVGAVARRCATTTSLSGWLKALATAKILKRWSTAAAMGDLS
uniref:Uncharacterized protein n=1 Tax=Oryza sativa subsp. japonica TaxID=39947 RepID=Q2QW22_ORYSJ|nr:hypothetical protein LOC_Os12g10840 [Oryza sativa Japonica Group]